MKQHLIVRLKNMGFDDFYLTEEYLTMELENSGTLKMRTDKFVHMTDAEFIRLIEDLNNAIS